MASAPPTWTQLTDLASFTLGGDILFATDDFFAPAEHMLQRDEPVFDPAAFGPYGKVMDGWESRRRRHVGHDYAIVKLGCPGVIRGFDLDTAFFTGNYVPKLSIQAACIPEDHETYGPVLANLEAIRKRERGDDTFGKIGTKASDEFLAAVEPLRSAEWEELVPRTKLAAGVPETRHTYVEVSDKRRWTHIRVNQYPDGGIARVRAYGTVFRDWSRVADTETIEASASTNGAIPLSWSDAHYGNPKMILGPGRGVSMADGWETARSFDRPEEFIADAEGNLIIPEADWTIIQLAIPVTVSRVEVDTIHFKGNFPESFTLEGATVDDTTGPPEELAKKLTWRPLISRTKLTAHAQHFFDIKGDAPVSHVKLSIFPDGGVSRLRVWGTKSSGESFAQHVEAPAGSFPGAAASGAGGAAGAGK